MVGWLLLKLVFAAALCAASVALARTSTTRSTSSWRSHDWPDRAVDRALPAKRGEARHQHPSEQGALTAAVNLTLLNEIARGRHSQLHQFDVEPCVSKTRRHAALAAAHLVRSDDSTRA